MTQAPAQNTDVLIAGAHIEGLVCATYLAKAGLRVHVVAAPQTPEGEAPNAVFHDDNFSTGICSHHPVQISRQMCGELGLEAQGWKEPGLKAPLLAPGLDGGYLFINSDRTTTQREIAKFSQADSDAYARLDDQLSRLGAVFDQVVNDMPPDMDMGWRDLWGVFHTAKILSKNPAEVQTLFAKLMKSSLNGYLGEAFETDLLRALVAFEAITGSMANPDREGSANILLFHLLSQAGGQDNGDWYTVRGSLNPFVRSLVAAARAAGVTVDLDAHIQSVQLNGKAVTAVGLSDGRIVQAGVYAADLNPVHLFLKLLDENLLPSDYRIKLRQQARRHGFLRAKVALSDLPRFKALTGYGDETFLGGNILLAPSTDSLRKAFEDVMMEGWSQRPLINMVLPSVTDPSLADEGGHTASLIIQYYDPDPDWLTSARNEIIIDIEDALTETISAFAPNYRDIVINTQFFQADHLHPVYGPACQTAQGGVMPMGQIFATRSMARAISSDTPFDNLYLCGHGAEAANMVMLGLNGRHAAQDILRQRQAAVAAQ